MPHSTYLPERMGTATLSPVDPVEAGSFQSFALVYTAGYFGIDDTGSIKIVQRFAGDMGRPQFTDPKAANYTTVEASNGALLDVRYEPKMNIRPWDKTLFIRVVRRFLNEGDTLTVRFGDRGRARPACACRPSWNRPSSSACWPILSPPTTMSSCRSSRHSRSWPALRCSGRRCCRPRALAARRFGWASRARTNGATPATRSMARLR